MSTSFMPRTSAQRPIAALMLCPACKSGHHETCVDEQLARIGRSVGCSCRSPRHV